jgi:SAM-dependent methyltransferase
MSLVERFHPEARLTGFNHLEGTITTYTLINSLIRPSDHILDFGGGRMACLEVDPIPYRRQLRCLGSKVPRAVGIDISRGVLWNLSLGEAVVQAHDSLPFPNTSFDLIIWHSAFEHVQRPDTIALQLTRMRRRGRLLGVVTPARLGYIARSPAHPNRVCTRPASVAHLGWTEVYASHSATL